MVEFDEDKSNRRIDDLLKKEEEDLALMLSSKYGVEYIDLSRVSIETDALRIIPEDEARAGKVAIFDAIGRKLRIALLAPEADHTKEILDSLKMKGYTTIPYIVSKASLDRAWDRYKEVSFASESKAGVLDISNEELEQFVEKVHSLGDVQALIENILQQKKSYRISRILEIVLAGALSVGASDIHVEAEEADARLRYRLDGVLTDIIHFNFETYNLLVSRIKLLSRLKLNVKNAAQDGRFSIKIGDAEIEIRTSVLPGSYGEAIVLRLLNPKSIQVPMEDLGIPDKLFAILDHEIKKPNGMLLTTGPTGSGKTTTLYAFLRRIHTPEIKIITIEDPIEYHLQGIVQTQADHKEYTFAMGLRSALRQDPDVIMVGEIRDSETAEIAINSSLTGHLVLSTLHTNSAAGAFPRLIDLGINPKIISSAINVVLAQRLIRKLCSKCAKQTAISDKLKPVVEKIVAGLPESEEKPETGMMWEAVGCPACNNVGYKGRVGIFEAVVMDEAIGHLIASNPGEDDIMATARPQGLLTLTEDGVLKALRGITTFEELVRVIDIGA